ncbi:MAG TPA: response regulator [Myxococcaceae bacterium]|nr:response regulator [Myxococcaceae bacterium]
MNPGLQARRILVVDDDAHTRNLLRDFCEQNGYWVSLASDGAEALEKLRAEPTDLVLLDLMMPHRDGFSVLQEIRTAESTREMPVIILTAMGDMDGKIRGMELGADDFVTKPFKLLELQTRVNSALLVREYRRKMQAAEDQLSQLRAVDPLTGAGTYAQLKASLDAELARSGRYGRPVAVLLLVMEGYQDLRYQVGREQCDKYLAAIARRIQQILRGADRLFRLDVDEFVVLLPETDLEGAHVTAERLSRVAGDLVYEGRDGPLVPRVRISGAAFPDERVHSSEDLLREANRRYQEMRGAGRARLVFDP